MVWIFPRERAYTDQACMVALEAPDRHAPAVLCTLTSSTTQAQITASTRSIYLFPPDLAAFLAQLQLLCTPTFGPFSTPRSFFRLTATCIDASRPRSSQCRLVTAQYLPLGCTIPSRLKFKRRHCSCLRAHSMYLCCLNMRPSGSSRLP